MKNNNLIRFIQSLLILPVMTMPVIFGGLHTTEIAQNVLAQKFNIDPVRGSLAEVLWTRDFVASETSNGIEAQKLKADAIDTYFKERSMPLAGMGMKMVIEADKNDLDWRLLPAIAVRESTGGKFECKKAEFNSFGWGSCKINFNSNDEAIETVARNLGGNNPKTAKHYDNKTTIQILRAYNPPSVIRRYAQQVISIMDDIGPADEEITSTPTTPNVNA